MTTPHDHDPRQIRVNRNAEPYCTECGAVLTRDHPAVRDALRLEQHSIVAQKLHNVYSQPRNENTPTPGFRGGKIPPPRSTHNQGTAIWDPLLRNHDKEEDAP